MTTFIKETAAIKARKIIVTTYGQTSTGTTFPATHIPFGIKEARETVAKLSSRDNLRPSTVARVSALRSGIELWDAK